MAYAWKKNHQYAAPPQLITQAELQYYLAQVQLVREHNSLRVDLTSRLEKHAIVESGPLTVFIELEPSVVMNKSKLVDEFGEHTAEEVIATLTIPVRRLRVTDPNGEMLGWHRKNGVQSNADPSSGSSAPLTQAGNTKSPGSTKPKARRLPKGAGRKAKNDS